MPAFERPNISDRPAKISPLRPFSSRTRAALTVNCMLRVRDAVASRPERERDRPPCSDAHACWAVALTPRPIDTLPKTLPSVDGRSAAGRALIVEYAADAFMIDMPALTGRPAYV